MLSLRLQRTGRKGYALYRLVAQDSHRSPTSGKVAAYLGSYNPHSKETTFDKEKVEFYLKHGAQPSDRVASLIKEAGVKLPSWYKPPTKKKRDIKHPEKLRKNRPPEAAAPVEEKPAEPAADNSEETPAAEETAEVATDGAEEQAAPEAEVAQDEEKSEVPAKEDKKDTAKAEPAAGS